MEITVQKLKQVPPTIVAGLPVFPGGWRDDGEAHVPEWGDFSWLKEQVEKKADREWVQKTRADQDLVLQVQKELSTAKQELAGKADRERLEEIVRLAEAGGRIEEIFQETTKKHLERIDQNVSKARSWLESEKRELALCRQAVESARDQAQQRGREAIERLEQLATECRANASVAVEKAQQEAAGAARARDEACRYAEAAREPQRRAEAAEQVAMAARTLADGASTRASNAEASARQGVAGVQSEVAKARDEQERSLRELSQHIHDRFAETAKQVEENAKTAQAAAEAQFRALNDAIQAQCQNLADRLADGERHVQALREALPVTGGFVARLKWLFAGTAAQQK